jgi:ribosomal protein S18 acetylase RimI-like enzyme
MAPDEVINLLEQRALRALPALEEENSDGWILRATRGYTGRANSAAPLDDGRLPLDDKLGHAEAWYAERNLPAMIRLTPAARPSGLDTALAARGYVLRDEGVSVQTFSLTPGDQPPAWVEIDSGPVPDEWLTTLAGFQLRVTQHFQTVQEVFTRLPASSAWAMIRKNGTPVAIGRAVLEGGDLGLFDVITQPDNRRAGLATHITEALLNWGIERGAVRAYLQVVPGNGPAVGLYRKLGFREAYRYWYRTKRNERFEV